MLTSANNKQQIPTSFFSLSKTPPERKRDAKREEIFFHSFVYDHIQNWAGEWLERWIQVRQGGLEESRRFLWRGDGGKLPSLLMISSVFGGRN
jgi:predicted LPLAT superfamily acyltransferase